MHFQCPHIHANCLCTSLLCTQFNGHIMHHTAFWHHRQFQNQWIFLMLYMYIWNEVGGRTFSVYFWNIQLFSGHSIHVSLTKIRISNLEAFCINIHNHLTLYSGYLPGSRAVLKLLRAWMLSLILWLIKVKSVCSLARKKEIVMNKTINRAKEWKMASPSNMLRINQWQVFHGFLLN